ncbi:hypothetical protein [Polyangium aurulentum]|uniref:hypothetical protein n=1 Tax=Polyangium aurulentum TaxID=2567896 RepID=UPI0010AEC73A|nr:hypothetical protein [Polyangium aurulentum]UQA59383.1 hypothetical protein E8A73_002415 [Polyangium aurulentum]
MPAGTCADPIDITGAIALNGSYQGIANQSANTTSAACYSASEDKANTLVFQVPAAGNYRFEATGPGGVTGHGLYVRAACDAPETELGCTSNDIPVRIGIPAPMTLYITVAGYWFESGYTLTITADPPCASDDDCKNTSFGPLCNPAGVCLECEGLDDCNGRLCDVMLGQCLPCSGASDCVGNPFGSYCSASGACKGCTVDAECAGKPQGQVCLQGTHSCGCTALADCPADKEACVASTCIDCKPGFIDCNGSGNDACEIDPLVNPSHCGGCGGCSYGGCNAGVCSPAPAVLHEGKAAVLAVDDDSVYFDDGGNLVALSKSNGMVSTLAPAQGTIRSIVVDAAHVYWSSHKIPITYIRRIPKGGGAPETLWSGDVDFFGTFFDLEIDATDAFFTYTLSASRYIARVPKSGGASTTVLSTDSLLQGDITVAGSYVFYNDFYDLRRVPKAGGQSMYLLQGDVKSDGTHLYYYDKSGGVHRCDLDGKNDTVIASPLPGWTLYVRAVDDTTIFLDGSSGPDGSMKSGLNKLNIFLFAVPKTGGMLSMIGAGVGSGQIRLDGFGSDATHVYFTTAGKLLRVAK